MTFYELRVNFALMCECRSSKPTLLMKEFEAKTRHGDCFQILMFLMLTGIYPPVGVITQAQCVQISGSPVLADMLYYDYKFE